jgi:hypothetical protein
MSFRHNSTIRIKEKKCKRCGKSKFIFSRGRCKECSTYEDTMARMQAESEDMIQEEGLPELIREADDIVSKWLRLSSADKDGLVYCYTCDKRYRWQDAHCGHYIKRGNLFLRYDHRNLRVQGECCNIFLDGNYGVFTDRLESEQPGLPEILMEESTTIYKPSREEIKGIIHEHKLLFRNLLNSKKC